MGSYNQDVQEAIDSMGHEAINIYAYGGTQLPYPAPTWYIFDESEAKDLYALSKEVFEKFAEDTQIYCSVIGLADRDNHKLFAAAYEIPQYGYKFIVLETTVSKEVDNPAISMEFVSGLPYGAVEIASVIYENMTRMLPKSQNSLVPPMPATLFSGMGQEVVYKYMWLEQGSGKAFIGRSSEDKKLENHWWFRYVTGFLDDDNKLKTYPIPGSFVGFGIRMFPNLPTGWQKSSPYMVSGHFLDTVYYTRCKIIDIEDAIETRPFKLYTVQWRRTTEDGEIEFKCRPSDYVDYNIDDYVTIMKDATTDRTSQTHNDDQEFKENIWRIVPVTFYTQVDK